MSDKFALVNDSIDDLLAEIDFSDEAATSKPSEPKKARKSTESFNKSATDSLLANLTLPEVDGISSSSSNANVKEPPATTSLTCAPPSVEIGIKSNVSKTNCILVNPKQRGNPILKSVTIVPWEFDNSIVPDYVVGLKAAILFLSLRYHQLNPDYIHDRLKELGKRYELRVLLVQVDTKVSQNHLQIGAELIFHWFFFSQDPSTALRNLTQMCLLADLTLMLAWNAEEAGKIVETYKAFETKPPDLIMPRAQQFPHQKVFSSSFSNAFSTRNYSPSFSSWWRRWQTLSRSTRPMPWPCFRIMVRWRNSFTQTKILCQCALVLGQERQNDWLPSSMSHFWRNKKTEIACLLVVIC